MMSTKASNSKSQEKVQNNSDGSKKEEYLPKGISETEDENQNHWFIGSIDQGTTSSRFLIFNGDGNPVASHQIEFENMYPKSG
jgi:glycerol kinase